MKNQHDLNKLWMNKKLISMNPWLCFWRNPKPSKTLSNIKKKQVHVAYLGGM
jgi:hypothetical protein